MIFLGGDRKVVPFRKVVSLLGLSTLFCWMIDGAHGDLHDPQVPGSVSRGGFESCLGFFSPS